MKTSWKEYVKLILRKVSFDRKLFRKEYKKSMQTLSSEEAMEVKAWVRKELMPVVIKIK